MAWSGGTYRKGNYSTNGWTGDASLGIGIEAGRHDTQDDDFMNGINQCLNKDGSNAVTGNLNLGSNRLTNVAAATTRTDAAQVGQVQDSAIVWGGTSGGTSTAYTITLSPAITAYATGQTFRWIANAAVTGAATINVNGVGAKALQRQGTALVGNEFKTGDVVEMVYDGTQFQILNVAQVPISANRTSGDVGINSPLPGFRLQVSCNTYNKGIAISGDGTNIGAFLHFLDNGTQRNVIHWDVGGFVSGSVNSLVARSGATGGVYLAQTGTSWVAVSDARFKKNVQNLNYGLNEIINLRPIRFDYIEDENDTSSRLGFIAQEVKYLIPEAVQGSEELRLGISTTDLIPALVNAIQELNAKVEALEARIAALEA